MLEDRLISRPRRLRANARLRDMVAETRIHPDRLMQPHFVREGSGDREEIPSMPGIHRETLDTLLAAVESDLELGIGNILLFGLPDHKDAAASGSAGDEAVVSRAVAAVKSRFGDDVLVATDVCLCAYTDHGHCGVLENGEVMNDASLPLLAEMALSHARAGADIVAPSDMMDGRVAAIRSRLDAEDFATTAIMSYAVKYASAYYGPFRDAADSAPAEGDRRSYQMDVRNRREAIREALTDEDEAADILMVKPALAYLDVISSVREVTTLPLAAYNVSGEYALVKLAAREGLADERALTLENLTAITRAGADILITYHGREVLKQHWL